MYLAMKNMFRFKLAQINRPAAGDLTQALTCHNYFSYTFYLY